MATTDKFSLIHVVAGPGQAGIRLRLVTQAPAGASSAQQKAGAGRVANLVQEICTDWYQQDDSGKYIYLTTTCEYVNVGSGSTGGSYSGGWGGTDSGGGGSTGGASIPAAIAPLEAQLEFDKLAFAPIFFDS